MTELEKAASGLLYDANSDPALLEARAQTSDLCMDYNALRSSQKEEKNALLHTILGACAPDIVIEPPFFVDYGSHTRVGRAFYANHNLVILDAAPVTIGDHVFIGAFATVLKGQVDAILLIGGMANSRYIVDLIRDRVGFIAPVAVQPGEREMESLCLNAYQGLTGKIQIRRFKEGKVHVPVF